MNGAKDLPERMALKKQLTLDFPHLTNEISGANSRHMPNITSSSENKVEMALCQPQGS